MINRDTIERIFDTYHQPEFLSIDPLTVVHRFKNSETLPEIALVAALFSYGRVPQIILAIEKILAGTDNLSPIFFKNHNFDTSERILPDFKYRFHTSGDLTILLHILADIRRTEESLTQFVSKISKNCKTGEELFQRFTSSFKERAEAYRSLDGGSFDWLFPSPSGGSPCKRIAMFFRWMVRQDDGIDLGIWDFIPTSFLIIPVDTHVARIGKLYSLTTKNSASWKMAVEITDNLKQLDKNDPVKYDFSLCRAGMLE